MSEPILVKGNARKVATIILIVIGAGLIVVGAGIALAAAKPVVAVVLALIGLAFCGSACLKHAFDVAGRVYLQLDPNGFRIRDRQGDMDYRDEDVVAMASEITAVLSNGTVTGGRRQATLQIDEEPAEFIRMDYTFPLGANADPVAGFFGRLESMLLARFRAQVAAGPPVSGAGWSLDAKALFIDAGEASGRYPFASLAAASIVDRKVTVWERGEAEAAIAVPLNTLNAWALLPLLQEHLPPDTGAEDERVGDGLGRVIFQRDKSWSVAGMVVAYVLGFGLAILGVPAAVLGVFIRAGGWIGMGIGMLVVGCIIAVVAFFNRVNVFRAHALGVTRTTTLGTKEVRYDQVGTFTWTAMRQFVNGAYTGTTMKVAFQPLAGVEAPAITYGTTLKGNDQELDNLRDFIAGVIACRWLREVQNGHTVAWTANSTFMPDGLDHKKGWFGGTRELIPYNTLLRWEARDGWLYVYGVASKPLVQEQINQDNFFPGLTLLLIIMGQGGIPPRQDEAGRADAKPVRTISSQVDDRIQRRTGAGPEV
jgi:hypothetical protein